MAKHDGYLLHYIVSPFAILRRAVTSSYTCAVQYTHHETHGPVMQARRLPPCISTAAYGGCQRYFSRSWPRQGELSAELRCRLT